MRRSATLRGYPEERRAAVDRCAEYLLKYRKHLRYQDYLSQGLPVATGVVEGACRHLINDRLDITGARWSMARAESILRIRALLANGDFDNYWRSHERRELARNHLSRYHAGKSPATISPHRHRRLRLVR